MHDGVDVRGFGLFCWAFDGDQLQGTELGQDPEQAGQRVGAEAGLAAVLVPVVSLCNDCDLARELLKIGVVLIRRLVSAVQDRGGVGDAWNEVVDGEAIGADVNAPSAVRREVLGETIGLVEGKGELLGGHLEADVAQVADGCEAVVRDLIDIKGEFRFARAGVRLRRSRRRRRSAREV